MIRTGMAAGFALLAMAALASAQAAPGLHWQAGQTLTYRVEQVSLASDAMGDNKAETRTKLNLLKRWQVVSVDAAGAATLQLSLASLRLETATPGGDKLLFDSLEPEKSAPELRDQLSKFVGKALALLRVDAQGRVLEVKESKFGPSSRYENELPFVGVLPADGPKAGQEWQRDYKITLEPPAGAGEKYDAVQKYVCKSVADGLAVASVTTSLVPAKAAPGGAEQAALLQMQPEGEIVFDLKAGRMKSASLKIDKEVKGHQGEGSSYHLQQTYTEEYVGDR
jgi:hypothetical protein